MAPTPPKVYPCDKCNFEAASARQLSRHKAITHVENPIKCVLCPFVTAYQTNLLRHRREVHGICGSKGNKSCKFCGFLSEDNDTLIRHQYEVHRDILKSAQVKFAREKLSALGDDIVGEDVKDGEAHQQLRYQQAAKPDHSDQFEQSADENDDDDDKDFWKEGFMDDAPSLWPVSLSFNQSKESSSAADPNNTLNWYSSSEQPSPPSHEGSISEFVSSRSSTPKLSSKAMPIPSSMAIDDLPATRIRRQYTCNDCGFRTINPREFLYHRRDEHGQRLKIVECPYCVYACQYVQKLQRHLLLVHKLTTSMTPPPEVSQTGSSRSKSAPKPSTSRDKHYSLTMPKSSHQKNIPKIRVKLPLSNFSAPKTSTPAASLPLLHASSSSASSPTKRSRFSFGPRHKLLPALQSRINRPQDKTLKKKFYKCQQCGYITNVSYLYKKHMKYHTAPKIKCEMCDFESPYSWNVDRHVRSHFANGLFKCTKCSFACDKKQALTVHITQHHRDHNGEGDQKVDDEMVDLNLDEIDDDEVPEEMLEQEMGKDDEEMEQADDKIEEVKGEEEKESIEVQESEMQDGDERSNEVPTKKSARPATMYVRQLDGKIVARQGQLKKCKYCQFQTDTFAKLQKHETSYHPEKKFKCPLCEIKFENLVWLQRHLSHMHQEDTQGQNIASVLDMLNPKKKKSTASSKSLADMPQLHVAGGGSSMKSGKQPMASSSKKKIMGLDKKSTQCQICGYQTRWISELEKHMRVHTNERPFACPYCSFKSKWKGDLNRHIQKYHSRLPMPDLNAMEQQIQMKNLDVNYGPSEPGSETGSQHEKNSDGEMNPAMFASVTMEEGDEYDDNIEEIKMDEELLPDDYEERPLVFDDLSDDDGEQADNDMEEHHQRPLMMHHQQQQQLAEKVPTPVPEVINDSGVGVGGGKHGKVKMYRCSYCDFTCSTASRFHVHFVQHLNTKPFQCSVCGHRSNWEWDVTKHIKMKSQRDSDHQNATAMLVHESGKRDYSKYNKYVVWVGEREAEACSSSGTKIDFRAKRARVETNEVEHDDGDNNATGDADYDDDGSYRNADPESIVITPDISFAVPGEDNDSSGGEGMMNFNNQYMKLQPNVPYNSGAGSSRMSAEEKCLQCSYCEFRHKESKVMVSHLSVHAGMKPYACQFCGFDSTWREVVVRHCISRHGGSSQDVEQRFRCTASKSICRIVDENGVVKQNMTQNLQLNSAAKAYQETHQSVRISGFKGSFKCDLCPFRAEKAFHMDFHVKRHQPMSGPYKCPHCPYWVNAKKSLVKHMLLHADKEQQRDLDDEDGQQSKYDEATGDGLSNVYDDDESESELVIYEGDDTNQSLSNGFAVPPRQSASVSKNKCDDCPFIAGTKTQLLYHKQFHRPNRLASYRCTYCSYAVTYLHLLNQHMKVHQQSQQDQHRFSGNEMPLQFAEQQNDDSTNDDERDESDIPFTFVQIGNVKRRLYQCRFCPTTSKRRTYIYVHEQQHTKNNDNYKCSHCEFVTKDSSEFLAHLSIHKTAPTYEPQPQSSPKVIKQPDLNLYSSSPSVSVIDVNNIRHGNRRMFSYVCPDCPAAFKSPGDLKIHSAFHGANHPHPCPYCNYRAKNKPQLCKHLYVHTAEYIAKRANSYPDGTKLLIGDAVDQMKRDLRSPFKESQSSFQEIQPSQEVIPKQAFHYKPKPSSTSLLKHPVHSVSLIKKPAADRTNAQPAIVPPELFNIPKEVIDKCKRPSFATNSRMPFEQMIRIELTETKTYIGKIESNVKHRSIYRCSQCPAAFLKLNTLTFHVTLHGFAGQYQCSYCNYSCDSLENVSTHQQIHNYKNVAAASAPSIYNHRCDRCPAAFSKKSRLEKHLTLHGLNAKWKCDKCDYAVHYAATLVKHRACHDLNPNFVADNDKLEELAPNENKEPAEEVEKSETSMPELKHSTRRRIPTPTSIPPLTLPPVVSGVNGTATTSPVDEKNLFCCERCPYIHQRKDAVQSHQKRHVGDQQARSPKDSKQCIYCDYTCLQPSYLREHINWHFEPPQDRKAVAFANCNEVEIRKYFDAAQEEQNPEKTPEKAGGNLLFKDLGPKINVRERFMPYEEDEEFYDMFSTAETNSSEMSDDDFEDQEDLYEEESEVKKEAQQGESDDNAKEDQEAQENEAAQALLQMQFNVAMDSSSPSYPVVAEENASANV